MQGRMNDDQMTRQSSKRTELKSDPDSCSSECVVLEKEVQEIKSQALELEV
jgi:hypothetical protein